MNLLVPVCTFYDGCDTTCELDQGDHDFIQHLSYVFYAKSLLVEADRIRKGLNSSILLRQPNIGEEVFSRVEGGVCLSPDTPLKIKQYFGC
ncbi:hypothetical protein E2K80_17685 [Rhodophyticola sp. CCM32]|uniref:hypothetical protein n=1 Tax=Rhodophyticola sp. CCM32 TaxID=2916397 RepID=UPI00107EF44B|nr:hypothetical protein [Rhodophyticola sp. CCM32]QBY02345.1 hypothetical protein E2K80_17685 [Rhodophyticola sp. CCM32]